MRLRFSKRPRSRSPLVLDRIITRFQRLVETHSEIRDLFSDLGEKQSGEYILDRQYVEAQLDRAYEGGRELLYNMHMISGSDGGQGYAQLDALRAVSEKILKDIQAHSDTHSRDESCLPGKEETDWELRALQSLYRDLTGLRGEGGRTVSSPVETGSANIKSLASLMEWAHAKTAQWLAEELGPASILPFVNLYAPRQAAQCIQLFPLGGIRKMEQKLEECLARVPPLSVELPSLLPFHYLLQGLNHLGEDQEVQQFRVVKPKKMREKECAFSTQIYIRESFLFVRMPSFSPVRLFWCSLSPQESENILYAYGGLSQPVPDRLLSSTSLSAEESSIEHGYRTSDTWAYWISSFPWTQGKERILLLGSLLADCLDFSWGSTPPEEAIMEQVQKNLYTFLTQIAICDHTR